MRTTPPSGSGRRGKSPDTHAVAQQPWMTRDWATRRTLRLRRLGEWVAMTRAKLGLTIRNLETQARRDGEDLSETLILRLEKMRLADNPTDERRRVSLTAVDYLAALNGQTLADVDAYLRTGDEAALNASEENEADSMRALYLALSPAHRRSVFDFAEHMYQLDLAAAGATSHVPRRGAVDPETQAARETLRAVAEGAIATLREQAGEASEDDATQKARRRRAK